MNNFYASAECSRNPELRGKPLAVCGNEKDRHGIVLAKSMEAKKMGIKTGDKISEAKIKCRNLIVVNPDFDLYLKLSRKVREIYKEYTDMIEPFGIDEAWLDVTGSVRLFGNGEDIANELRKRVKKETGMTISVGVSFCKSFAKLGSDMKKPDAVTVISKENFRNKVWCLPVGDLLFAGRSTVATLNKFGIFTVGEFANASPEFVRKILGKNGYSLWVVANGLDDIPVAKIGERAPIKSIGRGITCVDSLKSNEEVFRVVSELSSLIAEKLVLECLEANSLSVIIKLDNLELLVYNEHFIFPTNNDREIKEKAIKMILDNFEWNKNIRAVTVRATDLIGSTSPQQIGIEYNIARREKLDKAEKASINIKDRYGKNTMFSCGRLQGTKIPSEKPEYSVLPTSSFGI